MLEPTAVSTACLYCMQEPVGKPHPSYILMALCICSMYCSCYRHNVAGETVTGEW